MLVAALLDYIHFKKSYATPATKIVKLVPDQIASIATLVPLERRKTEEVPSGIQSTVFKHVLKDSLKLAIVFACQAQAMCTFSLS